MKGLGSGVAFGLLLAAPVLYAAAAAQPQAQVQSSPPAASPPAATDAHAAGGFDVSDCQACHEKAVDHMARTPHARLEGGCTSCHGDVSAHVKGALEKSEPGPSSPSSR